MRAHFLVVTEFLLLGISDLKTRRQYCWYGLLALVMMTTAIMRADVRVAAQALLWSRSFEFSA